LKRAFIAAIGIAAMAYAGLLLTSVPAGFPDGYISPYDRTTLVWVTVGTYALLLFGIFTLVAAVMQKLGRAGVGAVLAVIVAASLVTIDVCPRQAWCTPILEQLGIPGDDGQGG
jgi:hypothetical protein